MSDVVIELENVSKRYRIGGAPSKHDGLRHAIESVVRSPLRWLRTRSHEQVDDTSFWALRDVSFSVNRGDIVAIIGRNGAGKSTLLKILSRITPPTSGRISLHGRVSSLLEVGTGFHAELTGRENIFLNGAILGMRRAEIKAKFDEIVAFAEIGRFLDTPVKRYSSGMYVRLAFAVAAHLEPEILIVDEVLAVGDAAFQRKCMGKMGEVAGQGRTILFVSHNMAAVSHLCRRGVVLQSGSVKFVGSQTEALQAYLGSGADHSMDFRNRSDRAGTGAVKVVAAEVRDTDSNEIDCVPSGQDVDFVLYFENYANPSPSNVVVSLEVKTGMGTRVFLQHNRLSGDHFARLPDSGAFICRIKNLPLPAGRYQIGFSILGENGHLPFLDLIEDAFELVVVEGNFFGTGEVPPASHGVCLVRGRWRVDASARPPAAREAAGDPTLTAA